MDNNFPDSEFKRIILENSAFWLNTLDKDAKITLWNKAAEKISGYSAEEVMGRDDIWNLLYPDETYRDSILAKALEIINDGKELTDFETTITTKGGLLKTLSWNTHDIKDAQNNVIGSLAIARDVTRLRDHEKELQFMTQELEQKNLELKRLSITDKLTGLYNRLKLDETLEKEFLRSKRYGHAFGLILVDVDFFKNVNDAYGHQAGDKVLVEIAAVLRENIRKIDTVGRWGGEEFMIICPETGREESLKVAQALCQKIASFDFYVPETITACFGVTAYDGDESITKVVARADAALYSAKESGRNKAVAG